MDQMVKLNFEEQFLLHLSDNLRIELRGLQNWKVHFYIYK